jgi:hypothetical protein
MGKLYKRGKIWYMHDVVNGEEIRESLSTRDWQEARRLRNDRVNEILEGRAGASRRSSRQPFSQAVETWLDERKPHVCDKTWRTDSERSKAPGYRTKRRTTAPRRSLPIR